MSLSCLFHRHSEIINQHQFGCTETQDIFGKLDGSLSISAFCRKGPEATTSTVNRIAREFMDIQRKSVNINHKSVTTTNNHEHLTLALRAHSKARSGWEHVLCTHIQFPAHGPNLCPVKRIFFVLGSSQKHVLSSYIGSKARIKHSRTLDLSTGRQLQSTLILEHA